MAEELSFRGTAPSNRGYTPVEEVAATSLAWSFKVSKTGDNFFIKEYSLDDVDFTAKDLLDVQERIRQVLNKAGTLSEKYIDHFIEDGFYYQVKPWYEGMNLARYLMEDDGDPIARLHLGSIVTSLIVRVHEENIVHQDLKPQQFLMLPDPELTPVPYQMRISDFDWSFFQGESPLRRVSTPLWWSPEQINGTLPSKKSDIFTLGVILSEMLAGYWPFEKDGDEDGIDLKEMKRRVAEVEITKQPTDVEPTVTPIVNNIIMRCLALNPADRPEAVEVRDVLFKAQDGGGDEEEKEGITGTFRLECGDFTHSVFRDVRIGRDAMRKWLLYDDDGNRIYQYANKTPPLPLMIFLKGSSGWTVATDPGSRNRLRLDGKEIGSEPVLLKDGMELSLFSTKQGKTVCRWLIKAI